MSADRLATLVLGLACVLGAAGAPGARAAAVAESQQAFTIQDLVRLDRLSEIAVSPDGKRIAYTLRTTDMEANKGRTAVWVLDTGRRNAAPVRLTDLAANAGSASWSPDGRRIYYLSNRSGSSQVWRTDAPHSALGRGEAERAERGDTAQQITNLP